MPRLFCFGLGFSARHLAARLLAGGWQVAGTCRSREKADELKSEGIEAICFGGETEMDEPGLRAALAGASHILVSVPPDAQGDPVLRAAGPAIAALAPKPRWLGYLSTTGVYGDRGGGWVDETSALAPTGERGRRRVAAEAAWGAFCRGHAIPLHIFRLAGIYGPGRNQLETLRKGTAKRIDKPGQVFSRIHVADIAACLEASMTKELPGGLYNVCDDEPAPPHEVVAFAAALIGVEPPPLVPFAEIEPELSPMARSFYEDSKRCRNARMKRELGVTLQYPTYREGLRALCEEGGVGR